MNASAVWVSQVCDSNLFSVVLFYLNIEQISTTYTTASTSTN